MNHPFRATAAERRLLPGGRMQGPMPWAIAIMTFVTVLIAAGGLALGSAAALVERGARSGATLQLSSGGVSADAATALAAATPGVAAAQPVQPDELRTLLERWLGGSALSRDLPLPVLVDLQLAPGADPATVRQELERQLPGSTLALHGDTLAPLLSALDGLRLLALSLVVLASLATSATVALAARAALERNRSTIEVMHGIGATDAQVARLFQRRIAIDALAGGLIGAGAAALVLLLAAARSAGFAAELSGHRLLDGADFALLAALPFLGAAIAVLVARRSLLSALRESL